jgi:formate hydrogenlyase subunit 4
VLAENASIVFRMAPLTSFAATAAAAALIPSFALGMASAPVADLLVIAGLLAMGRAALALAAMDLGTAFGGIGASREMSFSAFAEPALLLVFLTLMLLAGTTNLDLIASLLRDGSLGLRVSLGLTLVATLAVAVAENGRIPVDNPASHLELGMIHEAMVLEYSGPDLALIEATAALKLLLWFTLTAAIFIPFGIAPGGAGPVAWTLGLGAWALKMLGMVAVLLGLLAAVFLFVSTGFA